MEGVEASRCRPNRLVLEDSDIEAVRKMDDMGDHESAVCLRTFCVCLFTLSD